jgi:hypothetical protein
MIFISHRGNIEGISPEIENSPDYIDAAIEAGYEVEVDIREKDGSLFLGHDAPQYPVRISWLLYRKDKLWLHLKDYNSLSIIDQHDLRYFWHEQDRFTLTSNGYIWSHDFQNPMTHRCIVPLLSLEEVRDYRQFDFYAVCSDYIESCVRKYS